MKTLSEDQEVVERLIEKIEEAFDRFPYPTGNDYHVAVKHMDYGDYSGEESIPKLWRSITNKEFERNYGFLHFLESPESFYYYPAYMCHVMKFGLEDDQVFGSFLQALKTEKELNVLSPDCRKVLSDFLLYCRDYYSISDLEDDPYIDSINKVIGKLEVGRNA